MSVESPEELPAELQALCEAVAACPSGLTLLRQGQLESVAVLFGARPALIEQVRGWLASEPRRQGIAEALLRACRSAPAGPPAAEAPPQARPPAPATSEALLRAALDVPGGEELLAEAPLETVAIVFGVHPSLVAGARELVRGKA